MENERAVGESRRLRRAKSETKNENSRPPYKMSREKPSNQTAENKTEKKDVIGGRVDVWANKFFKLE